MDIDFKTKISTLSTRDRVWFCSAMVAMVLADGNIDRAEVDFLVKVLGLIKEDTAVERLKKFIQYKTVPPLGAPVGIDRKLGMSMIVDLIRIAVSDKNFAESEKQMIRDIGQKLGFTPPEVEKLVLFGFELMSHPEAASG